MNHKERVRIIRRELAEAQQAERLGCVAIERERGKLAMRDAQQLRVLHGKLTAAVVVTETIKRLAVAIGIELDELRYSAKQLTCPCGRHHLTLASRNTCRDCKRAQMQTERNRQLAEEREASAEVGS